MRVCVVVLFAAGSIACGPVVANPDTTGSMSGTDSGPSESTTGIGESSSSESTGCTPSEEVCDGLDNDCNGLVDDGLGFGPLSDVIVVREDEGETGSCTSCRWASGLAIAPTSSGFLALWDLGLDGGQEQPSLFGRPLAGGGAPTSAVDLLRPDFVLELRTIPMLEPWPALGLPVEYDHRTGSNDRTSLMFVGGDGSTTVTAPIPGFGPYGVVRTVWTGERFVTAWEENDALNVAVLGPDGTFETMVDVDPVGRPGRIALGVYPGRVGLIIARVYTDPLEHEVWFAGLDAFGNVNVPARQVDVEYEPWQSIVGTELGWLHVRPNAWEEPSTRQVLSPQGDVLSEATPFEDGRHISDTAGFFVAHDHEFLTVWNDANGDSDMFVEFRDARGDLLRGWSGPLPEPLNAELAYLSTPHAHVEDGRVTLVWREGAEDSLPNRVYLRQFGCL